MVLQDLGRRINAAVQDLTRSPNLDEKVRDYDSSQDAG
jgi:signal recognition particle subunit SRP54